MLLPINFTFQIIKISIINIALTKIHHSLEIRKEMKALFARVSSKHSHLLPIASFNFESLGLSYSKFIVENDRETIALKVFARLTMHSPDFEKSEPHYFAQASSSRVGN